MGNFRRRLLTAPIALAPSPLRLDRENGTHASISTAGFGPTATSTFWNASKRQQCGSNVSSISPLLEGGHLIQWFLPLQGGNTRTGPSEPLRRFRADTWVFGLSFIVAFACAFGIGANDVANVSLPPQFTKWSIGLENS